MINICSMLTACSREFRAASERNQRYKHSYVSAYNRYRSQTINSLVVELQQRDARKLGPCPYARLNREFSRVCEHAIIFRASENPAGYSRFQASTSWVGNRGGQSQEFLGVRECLAHIAAHRVLSYAARKPGESSPLEAVRRGSQGRYSSRRKYPWREAGYPSSSVSY